MSIHRLCHFVDKIGTRDKDGCPPGSFLNADS